MKNFLSMLIVLLMLNVGYAQSAPKKFSELVGPVEFKTVEAKTPTAVPYITWGGELAAFHANGNSLTTQKDSIYDKLGLQLKFENGDDFPQQVRNYLQGKTPYIRGTYRMLGQASEVLGENSKTKPVIILQLTWSAGDHIVYVEPETNQQVVEGSVSIKTPTQLQGLKGKKIILQQGGPHVGLLDDTLRAADLTWRDITPVWVKDLTGPDGPAEALRQGKGDAACVITPDMIGLCSDVDQTGQGSEGTIKGARVINSTQTMSRSIADVWAVRSDYFQSHRTEVEKFVAGYLAASETVVKMRGEFDESGSFSQGTGPQYKSLLTFAQQTFGEDVLPTLEEDAHGLALDATFVRLTGNISFFMGTKDTNPTGFDAKQEVALDLAVNEGYATARRGFDKPNWDYRRIAELAKIPYVEPSNSPNRIRAEGLDVFPDSVELDKRTIVSFNISFEPNLTEFTTDTYAAEFDRVVNAASTFGNAVIVIRGHSDPTRTLADLVRAGLKKGILKQELVEVIKDENGKDRNIYRYEYNNEPLNLQNTEQIVKLIKNGVFDGVSCKCKDTDGVEFECCQPRQTMQAALNLSQARAAQVKESLEQFAKEKGITLDLTQLQPIGAGITEPVVAKPTNEQEALQNMRVEFRIIRVDAEAINPDAFDF